MGTLKENAKYRLEFVMEGMQQDEKWDQYRISLEL